MDARRLDVDLVKAVGSVAVVWIHCMRAFFDPAVSAEERWLGDALQFAVPGFFAASGVLMASGRTGASLTPARLRRVLIPYLLASIAAQLYAWLALDRELSALQLLRDFVLGASFGPYYYVFHAVLFVLAAPVLAQLSRGALAAVTSAALLAQVGSWAVPDAFSAGLRNPLLWLGFFLAGWQLRRHDAGVVGWLAPRRREVAAVALGAAAALSLHQPLGAPDQLAGLLQWLLVACALVAFAALGTGRETRSRLVGFLSDSTYTVYLFHLFFVYALQRALPAPAPGAFEPLAIALPWLAGLTGPLALAAAGRAVLGAARSRALLGS
jgi:surface polysaccharide O-acyltransferase-like enzyme